MEPFFLFVFILQSNGVSIKNLREKFQNDESLMFRTKPAIPVKPQNIPSPTKVSNPLIASINSAMKSPTHLAPRVVFKEDKKSPTETSPKKMQPQNLDKNQKKEGYLIKDALKDRITLVQSKIPILDDTSRTEPNKTLESLVESATPITMNENEQTKSSDWTSSATSMLNHYDPSTSVLSVKPQTNLPAAPTAPVSSVQVKPSIPFTDHMVNPPVSYKARVPPVQMDPSMPFIPSTEDQPTSSRPIPAVRVGPNISTPAMVPRTGTVSEVQTVPEPDITLQFGQLSKPEVSDVPTTVPKANNYYHWLPDEPAPSSDVLDFFDDIPPPIIPEDFTDSVSPGFRSLAPSYTPSPTRTTYSNKPLEHSVTPDHSLLPNVNTVFTYSPLPTPSATDMTPENKFTEYPKTIELTERFPAPPSPALSALARAEEMNPVKPRDNRLLNLLEKAKKKAEGTPESMSSIDTGLPFAFRPQKASAEPSIHLEAPEIPESFVAPPGLPSVDYTDKEDYNALPALINGQDHSKYQCFVLFYSR